MRRLALTLALLLFVLPAGAATFTSNGPTTTNNDDSCDIGLFPAATLLVPYFEVALSNAGFGQTTIFTVTNTSNLPQSARVTLWTDYGYPVIDFPLYLTGYDVQSINLFDIIGRGQIAPSTGTGSDVSPVGKLSGTPPNDDFDNPQLSEASCVNLPVQLPSIYITRMQQAFTLGRIPAIGSTPECSGVGGAHTNAVGYATIDVVGVCSSSLPTDAVYFSSEIRFDNVLMGDYLQVDPSNDSAQGDPMVHIRAIPEGGSSSTHQATNFARTFYSHLQNNATTDARQPLPATFGARWISGGATGFETFYKIWREVDTGATLECSAYTGNATMPAVEIVRFDEEENPEAFAPSTTPTLPATSIVAITNTNVIPPNTGGDIAGWTYFNLHNKRAGSIASQNWIVTSMRAEGRFSVDVDAVALGNGCSPVKASSNATTSNGPVIGPASNPNP